MLVGIMSDSHDNLPAIGSAVRVFNDEKVVSVLHAGDLVAPFTYNELKKLQMPLHITFGNNDGELLGLKKVFGEKIHIPPYRLNLAGKKIVIMHEPDNLAAVAASGHFDLILYGHTHEVDVRIDETIIVNPGECGGWMTGKSTVAIWDTDAEEVDIVEV
jgi:putative phosphoesterase